MPGGFVVSMAVRVGDEPVDFTGNNRRVDEFGRRGEARQGSAPEHPLQSFRVLPGRHTLAGVPSGTYRRSRGIDAGDYGFVGSYERRFRRQNEGMPNEVFALRLGEGHRSARR